MSKTASLLLALSIGIPFTAMADVTLQIPEDVDVLAINSHQPEKSSGLFGSDEETLKDGLNQIVFKYSPSFMVGTDLKQAYSDVYVAKLDAKDTKLSFKLPDYKSINDAREHIDNMQWSLVDSQGNNVVIAQDKLKKNGIQLGRDYVAEVKEYNLNGGVAAMSTVLVIASQTQPVTKASSTSTKVTQAPESNMSVSNLNQLKAWYKKSSQQERKAFRKWIIDQE
ncbi:DUF2057 family protein [Vibrio nitrifigilis]|uniref:UPF0319 protein I1A42_05450 n=1 Tax=Vibrio nitrifigilis TaxID=2789781 RepID=A0ABS0GC72_9VIBR|nr:DUF2057 family protein [Vibrio nitrifigilis]MBF9000007.1 DUF2057 family protein [Vibrio nitrifigilis]